MPFPFNIYFAALFGAGVTTFMALPLWRRWCERAGVVDDPGERKIHATPIPLAGGLGVMTGIFIPLLAGILYISYHSFFRWKGIYPYTTLWFLNYGISHRSVQLCGIAFGALGMLLLGLWDDKFELRPAVKFGGQLAIAFLVAATGVRITLFVPNIVFSYSITILWILTVINAFNFMDNMNGLCAGLGAIGAWYFALISASDGQYLVAAIAFLVAGALTGFLPYNFPKARAFLGDAGSHLIGFLLAVLAILPHFYTRQHPKTFAVFAPLFILGMPLADLVWVVILRWRLGKPFYIGDNNHLSHRLVRRGWSPTRAVLFIWLLSAALGALAFF